MASTLQTFTIKKGDTRPKIIGILSAASTDVFTSVVFNMRDQSGTLVVNRGAGAIDAQPDTTQGGKVSYQWVSPNTNNAGSFAAEFEVTFSDGRIESYPNSGYLTVRVTEDIA